LPLLLLLLLAYKYSHMMAGSLACSLALQLGQ
jgi:hypothetical protein